MSQKRSHIDIDPDYEDVSNHQNKRQRVMEQGAKIATKHKIEEIVQQQFDNEILHKEKEIVTISERLDEARRVMDRLRACIVANYYGNASQQRGPQSKSSQQTPMIHPCVKQYLGKAPRGTTDQPLSSKPEVKIKIESPANPEPWTGIETIGEMSQKRPAEEASTSGKSTPTTSAAPKPPSNNTTVSDTRTGRFKLKKRIIVGNVSKNIPADKRDENDQATHKWMVYVRGPKEAPRIDGFVRKVWFFLHPSYRPNDLVEVTQHPFHLTRRGWGEFPVRVQLHFKDQRNKRLDIIHSLKLDRTYTGLQTLGAETVVDVELERDHTEVSKEKSHQKHVSKSSQKSPRKKDLNKNANSSCDLTNNTGAPVMIKQEPGLEDSQLLHDGTTVVRGDSPNVLLKKFKTETVDHDYGMPSVIHTPHENSMELHPLIISSSTPTVNHTQMSPPSPLQTTPSKAKSPRGRPVTPKSARRKTNPDPQSPKSLGTVPSPVPVSGTCAISQANFKLIDNKTGLILQQTGSQPMIKVSAGSQLPVATNFAGNQASLPGLVFLKYNDNQGKTYLIPQQLYPAVAATKGQNSVSPGKVATPLISQPVLLTNMVQSNQTNVKFPVMPTTVQGNKLMQSPPPVINATQLSSLGLQPVLKQSPQVNGPVIFMKPENVQNIQVKSPVTSPAHSSTQNLRLVSPSQILNQVKAVNSLHTVNQSNVKGQISQLKVTSQGLINVVHGKGQGEVTTTTTMHGNVITVPKQPVSTTIAKQPVVFIPQNNKLTVLPTVAGKNKSLLTSPNNLVVLNQAKPVIANQHHISLATSSNQNKVVNIQTGKTTVIKSVDAAKPADMLLLQAQKSRVGHPNHLVIVPVSSSHTTVSMTTSVQNSQPLVATKVTTSHRSTVPTCALTTMANSQPKCSVKSGDPKTMYIVVQGQGGMLTETKVNSEGQKASNVQQIPSVSVNKSQNLEVKKAMASLLKAPSLKCPPRETSKPLESLLSVSSNISTSNSQMSRASPMVTFSKNIIKPVPAITSPSSLSVIKMASDTKPGRIVVVDRSESPNFSQKSWQQDYEKKIIDLKKRKAAAKEPPQKEKGIIKPLSIEHYKDMVSLIRAAVTRHPLVHTTAVKHLHPYCARSMEQWLSWNLGKRRASEWQRASSVRRFIVSQLGGATTCQGQQLWSTKQILTWCRLHAYSPHYMEKPLHPTGIDIQAETSLSADTRQKFCSITGVREVEEEMSRLRSETDSGYIDSEDEDVDVVSTATPTTKVRPEREEVVIEMEQQLPVSDGAHFVQEAAMQVGVKFKPVEVEPGVSGSVSEDLIFKSMLSFMEDLLRETFGTQENRGRYPDALGMADVYNALSKQPITDFVTNKHLGITEEKCQPDHDR